MVRTGSIIFFFGSDKDFFPEDRFGEIVYFKGNRNMIQNVIQIVGISNPFNIPDIISMKVDIQIADFNFKEVAFQSIF